jgi:hypothetical protein
MVTTGLQRVLGLKVLTAVEMYMFGLKDGRTSVTEIHRTLRWHIEYGSIIYWNCKI